MIVNSLKTFSRVVLPLCSHKSLSTNVLIRQTVLGKHFLGHPRSSSTSLSDSKSCANFRSTQYNGDHNSHSYLFS